MRLALWSVILAAVAVGIALFARHSTGYVVIVSAPYRIELSLNLLIFLVLAGYLAFYTLARLISTLAAIPETPTWAAMLVGFASLGFASFRAKRRAAA